MLTAPRRAVRRKGYGIHSPFAFDFVRRVISQPCAYYAYATLRNGDHLSRSYVRLLFRVALHFRPRTIAIDGPVGKMELNALTLGSPNAAFTDAPADLMLLTGEPGVTIEQLCRCADSGGVVFFANTDQSPQMAATVAAMWDATRHGMLFRGSKVAIYVGLRHLPHQRFDLWL